MYRYPSLKFVRNLLSWYVQMHPASQSPATVANRSKIFNSILQKHVLFSFLSN